MLISQRPMRTGLRSAPAGGGDKLADVSEELLTGSRRYAGALVNQRDRRSVKAVGATGRRIEAGQSDPVIHEATILAGSKMMSPECGETQEPA